MSKYFLKYEYIYHIILVLVEFIMITVIIEHVIYTLKTTYFKIIIYILNFKIKTRAPPTVQLKRNISTHG